MRTIEYIITEKPNREEYDRIIDEFTLMDDFFMNVCFSGQPKLVETVLRIITEKPDLTVKSAVTQKKYPNLHGHSITLDIEASDSSGREYDIEFQRASKGAKPERARYHGSVMDSSFLNVSEDFGKLPDVYIIFITENDILGKNVPIYRIERMYEIEINGKKEAFPFNDRSHIIYINAAYNGDVSKSDLAKLVHDIKCKDPDEMYIKDIAERVYNLKNSQKGRNYMSIDIDQWFQDNAKELAQRIAVRLAEEKAADMAKGMAADMAKGMAADMAKGMAADMAKGMAADMAKGMAADMAKGMASDMTKKEISQTKLTIANNFITLGNISHKDISAATGLPLEEIEKLAADMKKGVSETGSAR